MTHAEGEERPQHASRSGGPQRRGCAVQRHTRRTARVADRLAGSSRPGLPSRPAGRLGALEHDRSGDHCRLCRGTATAGRPTAWTVATSAAQPDPSASCAGTASRVAGARMGYVVGPQGRNRTDTGSGISHSESLAEGRLVAAARDPSRGSYRTRSDARPQAALLTDLPAPTTKALDRPVGTSRTPLPADEVDYGRTHLTVLTKPVT